MFYYRQYYILERIYRKIRFFLSSTVYKIVFHNKSLKIGYGSKFYVSDIEFKKNILIGNNVVISTELNGGYLKIGNNVQIDDNVFIDCSGGINIKDNVHISTGVTIYTHEHGDCPKNYPKTKQLTISKNCWLGEKCSILQNVEIIEENNLIGYGSIVTKPIIIKNSVWVGIPSKCIRKRKNV